jgi:hypothetical protein
MLIVYKGQHYQVTATQLAPEILTKTSLSYIPSQHSL